MREGLQKIVASDDTIVAVSTPFGRSGIGVVRISGPDALRVARNFFSGSTALAHRQAIVGRWRDSNGETIDEVVCTFFRGPASYTGQDILEVSAHGNPLVLDRIIETTQSAGLRIAAPGEFTFRAVCHGKMDLTQAEAVRDFIEAQTETQARIARRQVEGGLSRRVAPLKEDLVQVIARLEAGIDFAEDDVTVPDSNWLGERLRGVLAGLEQLRESYAYGRLISTGIRVVIAGRPNVGKSSLFNKLLAKDRAIVTDIPGTTRDVLSETATLDGIPLRYFDTAGVREATETVERMGVRRTLETVADAELVLLVLDGSVSATEEDKELLERMSGLPRMIVVNKCDLGTVRSEVDGSEVQQFRVSARTGEGLPALVDGIRAFLSGTRGAGVGESILTTARQNDAVVRAIGGVESASRAAAAGVPQEMLALDLYAALSALNELTGEVVTEDILGRIFETFCIGK